GAALLRDRSEKGRAGAGRLRRFALRFDAGAEIGTPAQRLVVCRPLLASRELLLDPVEAAQPTTQVVDHVHQRRLASARNHGAAVLERAVVAEDDVQDRLLEVGGEAV